MNRLQSHHIIHPHSTIGGTTSSRSPARATLSVMCALLCCLTSCVDEESELSLEGLRCVSPQARELYFSGDSPSSVEDLRGVWSLEVERCVFTEELEEASLAEWRTLRSAPFVVRFDERSRKLTFEGLNGAPFEGDAIALNNQRAPLNENQSPQHLSLRLPYTAYDEAEGEGEGVMFLELSFEGGEELFLSADQARDYSSSYAQITGSAYRLQGSQRAQVGLFVLRQHPRSQEASQ